MSLDPVLATKLTNAGISALGFTGGVAVLYFLRPGMAVRTILVSLSALVLVAAILLAGDLFATELASSKYPLLKEAGWFSLGLLFGTGRGDLIVSYFDRRKAIGSQSFENLKKPHVENLSGQGEEAGSEENSEIKKGD